MLAIRFNHTVCVAPLEPSTRNVGYWPARVAWPEEPLGPILKLYPNRIAFVGSDNRQPGYPFRIKDGTVRIIKGCATSLR